MKAIYTAFPSIILETKRLWLKELTHELLISVFSTYSDDDLKQFLGLETDAELSLEKEKVQKGLSMYRISYRAFLMIEKATDRSLGRIGFHWWHVPHSRGEIG